MNPITPDRFDAVLFDLDGVLTATAKVHSSAWKRMLDGFLLKWAAEHDEPFKSFDIDEDYRLYVDGKARVDGVRSFLESRGINLPEGDVNDPPDTLSVAGLGNRKNDLIQAVLSSDGVEVYEGSIRLVRGLRAQGIKTAVVSSSKNCQAVLRSAQIEELFDVRVDGQVAEERDLPGKPRPDTFLAAARELGVEPPRAVVVEDALAGVQAGRAGGFGLVVGIARHDDKDALRRAGADVVVDDLGEWA